MQTNAYNITVDLYSGSTVNVVVHTVHNLENSCKDTLASEIERCLEDQHNITDSDWSGWECDDFDLEV